MAGSTFFSDNCEINSCHKHEDKILECKIKKKLGMPF